jgi:acetyl esterase
VVSYSFTDVEQNTRAFLESLQQNPCPQIYTLSPALARDVLSGPQAGPVTKLPADIENRTISGGPTGEKSTNFFDLQIAAMKRCLL